MADPCIVRYLKAVGDKTKLNEINKRIEKGEDVAAIDVEMREKTIRDDYKKLFDELNDLKKKLGLKNIQQYVEPVSEQKPITKEGEQGIVSEQPPAKAAVIKPEEVKHPQTITIKPKQDALSKQVSDEMDVRQQTGDGKTMGEGDAKPQISAGEKEKGKGEGEEPPVSDLPGGGGVFSEQPPTELSFRGLQRIANEFSFPDVESRDRKSDIKLRQEARETVDDWAAKGVYKENVEKLIGNAESNQVLTDKERVILEGHLANVAEEARQIPNKNSPEYDAKLAELKRLKNAGQKTRSEAGAALRIPIGGSRPKTIEDAMVEAMDDVGVDRLTPKQKQEVTEQWDKLEKAREDFEAYKAKKEEELAQREAELEIKKAKPAAKKTKKTHEDFVNERKSLKEELEAARKEHEEWLKEQGIKQAGVGGFSLTSKEAKIIAKFVKSYAEEGIVKLQEVVDKVFSEVKGVIPGITENDVRDVIRGAYADKKPTRTQLTIDLQNLKTEQNLIDKLQKLEAGEEPVSEKKKIKRNKEIFDLRKKIKEHDLTKLAARKENISRQIEKIREKISSGDFAPPEKKKPLELDAEGSKLQDSLIKERQRYDARRLLWQRQNEGSGKRLARIANEVAGLPRSLMTIADFSALLRQNIFFSAGHPLMTLRNTPDMFRSFTSQKVYDRWFVNIESSPRYAAAKESRLALADSLSHDLSKREEQFMSTLAEKIPGIGKVVKGSERSYTMLLNKMRWDVFNYFVDKLEARGLTYQNSPKVYKAVAEYVNNATGRSDFGETLNRIAPVLNNTFFSPRLIASRVNMLTYWAQPRFWKTLPREVRVDYFRNWASLLAVGGTVLALAKLAGAETEDDPRSADFGKIKVGNTRWDIWSGFQPFIRTFWQVLTGERKSTKSDKIYELSGDDIFNETRGGVIADFVRNKLAPVPGAVVDILSGRTAVGDKIVYQWGGDGYKEIPINEYIMERVLPMTVTGTHEAIKDRGLKALFDVGIPTTFGVGSQVYSDEKRPSKKDRRPKRAQRKFVKND